MIVLDDDCRLVTCFDVLSCDGILSSCHDFQIHNSIRFQWELKFAASTYSNILLVPLSACKAIKNEPTLPRSLDLLLVTFKASLILIWLRVKLVTHGSIRTSEFCSPETFNTKGKLNSLFPMGPIIKCFVITPNWKYNNLQMGMMCMRSKIDNTELQQ